MVQTAIQLYTLRGLNTSLSELIRRVGKTEFEGIELWDAQFDALDDELDRVSNALEETDLKALSAHISIDRLESDLENVVKACNRLGCSTVVIPTYDPAGFETREAASNTADRIAEVAADLAPHDLELLYHNHSFEFTDLGDVVAFEVFVEQAAGRFGFEPDTGLARSGGYDALELLETVGGQAPIVHFTDTNPDNPDAPHVNLGEGVIDVDAVADVAVEIGAEWFICENGVTTDGAEALEHGSKAFADLQARLDR